MNTILDFPIKPAQAALWFLGQAGYVIRSASETIVIDPYLSDSAAKVSPSLSRRTPVPIDPAELRTDIFIVTHDHDDHLDPETIGPYRYRDTTTFVAPRLASRKLASMGIPADRIRTVDSGETCTIGGATITGVYAVPTDPGVIDTTGYRIEFSNGRSVYHSSDTAYSGLLLEAVPPVEVALLCINGKWGNLTADQAAKLAAHMRPLVAIPNHYDTMEVNSENPKAFEYFLQGEDPGIAVRILDILEPFEWGE